VVAGLTVVSLVGIKFFEKRLQKDWYQEMTIISQDLAGQFAYIQEVITKHAFEVINFGISKDLDRKEVTANFLLRIRTARPDRQMLQEVFELPGVKRVDLV
jgi:hypothetical protein